MSSHSSQEGMLSSPRRRSLTKAGVPSRRNIGPRGSYNKEATLKDYTRRLRQQVVNGRRPLAPLPTTSAGLYDRSSQKSEAQPAPMRPWPSLALGQTVNQLAGVPLAGVMVNGVWITPPFSPTKPVSLDEFLGPGWEEEFSRLAAEEQHRQEWLQSLQWLQHQQQQQEQQQQEQQQHQQQQQQQQLPAALWPYYHGAPIDIGAQPVAGLNDAVVDDGWQHFVNFDAEAV